jgi:hypothetical protein
VTTKQETRAFVNGLIAAMLVGMTLHAIMIGSLLNRVGKLEAAAAAARAEKEGQNPP